MLFLTLFCMSPLAAQSQGRDAFAVPDGLEDEVRFWRTVFGTYGGNQVIFYDEEHLNVIYEVVDFSGLNSRKNLNSTAKRAARQAEINRTQRKIANALRTIASGAKASALTDEQRYYQKLFEGSSDPNRFRAAAGRIRVQVGQKDNLRRAITKAAPWMGDIEAIFEKNGVPKELTALMFIESMFNPRAISDVGASGVWQFMPETGRSYVSMNDFWDDRNDTINASLGAARFLKDLHNQTGDWPLAINAYNSGLGRINSAVRQLGTKKIATIVHRFKGPGYGFYSRNYVAEFYAVVGLYRNREDFFGAQTESDDRQYDIVQTADFVVLPKIIDRFGISLNDLRRLNTALSEKVLTGQLPLPPHYPLKVPRGTGYYLAVVVGSLAPDKKWTVP